MSPLPTGASTTLSVLVKDDASDYLTMIEIVLTCEVMVVFVAIFHPAHYQHYRRGFCD
jgi:hypothetical protein